MLRSIYDEGPLSLQSDYARANDSAVAALASLGLITSITSDGAYTRQWRLTVRGAAAYLETP